MLKFSISPKELIKCIWRHSNLIKTSAKREVVGRYNGSILGLLWSFFNPLFMLAVYTFIFSEVFKARWGTSNGSKAEFALILFTGLIIFNLFAECINRAPTLIFSNINYVKKVIYPLEILPIIAFLSAAFHGFISLIVWMIAYVIFCGVPHITVLYFPIIIIPFALFTMGVSWVLASLGVYLRDVSQVVGIMTTVLLFISPIFYPASSIPDSYKKLLYFNPLTPIIEQAREVLFWGKAPAFKMLAICFVISLAIAWLGFAWFQKTRKGFADVI